LKKANRRITEDVEAQQPPLSTTSAPVDIINTDAAGQGHARSAGRGGAGNFIYSPTNSDPNNNSAFNAPTVPPPTPIDAPTPSSSTPPVFGITTTITAGTATATTSKTTGHSQGHQAQPGRYNYSGRGGAGNILATAARVAAEQKVKDAELEKAVGERVAGDVERGLERPGKAVLRE
jgi:hypothetical protein